MPQAVGLAGLAPRCQHPCRPGSGGGWMAV